MVQESWYVHQYIGVSTPPLAQDIQFLQIRSQIEQAVSSVFSVPVCELRAPTRRRAPVAFARQVAMYLAHVVYGLPLTRVGKLFARDRTTVAHGCGVVEDRRDEPVLDQALTILESVLKEPSFVMDGGVR